MAAQRIKVNVSDLIARVETAKVAAEKRLATDLKKYRSELETYEYQLASLQDEERAFARRVADDLVTHARLLRSGKAKVEIDDRYRNGRYVDYVQVKLTSRKPTKRNLDKPAQPALDSRYERDLSLLQMSAADIITISVEDQQWGRYL